MSVWASLDQGAIFEEYTIESIRDNTIWMECLAEDFIRAVKSGQNASVTMRLTKKAENPVLSLDIQAHSRSGRPLQMNQDVPVRLLAEDRTRSLMEPNLPDSDVNIVMPPMSLLKSVVEKFKSMGTLVTLFANNAGEFGLRVNGEGVKVETSFKSLVNPEPVPDENAAPTQVKENLYQFYDIQIDVKHLVKTLACSILDPSHIVCCLFSEKWVQFFVYIGQSISGDSSGTLLYCIPARESD